MATLLWSPWITHPIYFCMVFDILGNFFLFSCVDCTCKCIRISQFMGKPYQKSFASSTTCLNERYSLVDRTFGRRVIDFFWVWNIISVHIHYAASFYAPNGIILRTGNIRAKTEFLSQDFNQIQRSVFGSQLLAVLTHGLHTRSYE